MDVRTRSTNFLLAALTFLACCRLQCMYSGMCIPLTFHSYQAQRYFRQILDAYLEYLLYLPRDLRLYMGTETPNSCGARNTAA